MKSRILVVFFLISLGFSVSAQKQGSGDKHRHGFDIEKFKEKRAEYLKKEVGLTDEEAKVLLPLTNELMKKKYEANKRIREATKALKRSDKPTDAQYEALVNDVLDNQIKEAQLDKEYYVKYKKVLSPEKLYKYMNAERKFIKNVISDYNRDEKK